MLERSVAREATPTWGQAQITAEQAAVFARQVTAHPGERDAVARNLAAFPPNISVRGLFFEGLSRVVSSVQGPEAIAELALRAGTPRKTNAFGNYSHRDFYKLYYLAVRLLHPQATMPEGLRLVAHTFFPIFRNSMLGRTMSALMGNRPTTILPLLARAYQISVEGNQHHAELAGERELLWDCSVEPVEWYVDIFSGIVQGAMPEHVTAQIKVMRRSHVGGLAQYQFRITW
jgi:uncharacterized protein (TIGR02265 family)